jgi:LuxR family maltose regulon positive regulatory protein
VPSSVSQRQNVDFRSVIRAKLRPSPCAPDLLFRSRLVEQIATTRARLTVLDAPAGYGKTTLMAQSAEHCRSRSLQTAWLTVDDDDCDPAVFLADLIASISATGLDLGDLVGEPQKATAPLHTRAALAALLNGMASSPSAGVIFIDDWHRAGTAQTSELLQRFLDNLPAGWRVVLASRVRLAIRLAKLSSDFNLVQIGTQDLRFTFVEAQRQFGEFSNIQLRSVMRHAEGWPVALQLARICLSSQPSSAGLEHFTGRTPELATYLAEQVFGQLPDELQDVLLRVSFARRFNGSLVNHLCNRSDGWELLGDMERRNLFVSPADDAHEWFQFHQLFAEFLQERCRRRGDLSIPGLHRSAAIWFLDEGHIQDAIRHTSLAADPELACRVIEQAGGWRVILRGGTAAMRHLTELSSELASKRSQLQLARIMLLAKEGRLVVARAALEELRAATDEFRHWQEGDRDLSADGFVVDLVLRGYEDRAGDLSRLAVLEQGMPDGQSLDAGVAAVLHLLHAQASYATGDYIEACRHGEAGLLTCRAAEAGYLEIFGQLNFGLSLLGRADCERAEAMFWTAIRTASDVLGADNTMVAPIQVFLAEIRYLRNELAEAQELLDTALPQLESSDTWFDIWASALSVDASLSMAARGLEAAFERLDLAAESAHRRGMGRLMDLIFIERVRLLTQAKRIDEASRAAEESRFVELVASAGPTPNFRFGLWAQAMLASARLENARRRPRDALVAIRTLEPALLERGHLRTLVAVRIQKAVAHSLLGDPRPALEALREALQIGGSEAMRRTFIDEAETAERVYQLGARAGNVLSDSERAFLRGVLAGRPGDGATAGADQGHMSSLSPRESQILSFLVAGLTNKEMARQLTISESTVVTHRRRLYRKLHVTSRSRAIAVARELVSPV